MRLQVRSLALLSGLGIRIAVNCGVACRHGLDLALLWLWHRLEAAAPIGLLAWEPPYAMGLALEKSKKKKKKRHTPTHTKHCSLNYSILLVRNSIVMEVRFFNLKLYEDNRKYLLLCSKETWERLSLNFYASPLRNYIEQVEKKINRLNFQ